jgi:myosin heavy subunit
MLNYLAQLSGKNSKVEQQIIDSSPILEAFGNAKTGRFSTFHIEFYLKATELA